MSISVTKQIMNGLRLTATGFVGLILLFVLFDGELRIDGCLHDGGSSTNGLLGTGEILIVAVVLWLTIRVWSQWVAAVAFLGALKATFGLIAGTVLMPPFRPVSRVLAAEAVAYLFAAGMLSVRFMSRQPMIFEKIALIIFVFATCATMLFEPSHLASLAGLVALLLARMKPGIFVHSAPVSEGGDRR
jgi:hypothetical protein